MCNSRPANATLATNAKRCVTNAQGADLLLPLLQGACLADRRQLCACFVEVQVLSVGADLLFWQ